MNKIKEAPKGLKASVAFFFASLVSKGIAYITTPIYTRILSTDVYGQTQVFFTWMQIFGIVAMFSLANGVFNNGMTDYPDRRDEYSFSMIGLANVTTLVFSLIIIISYPFLKEIIKVDFPLLILMLVNFIFQPAYSFWAAKQRYEYKYKYNTLWTIIIAIIAPLVSIIAITVFKNSPLYARILGAEIPLTIIYVGFYIACAQKNHFHINKQYWKSAFLFNLPLIPHYLSAYLLGSSDKIMIQNLVGDSATAFYSVAYSVSALALIVWNAVNASLIPYTYEKCRDKRYKDISKVTIPILWIFALVCLIVVMLAPEVVYLMATKDYMEAIYVIPPIIGGVFFQVQYYVYANIVYYYKKPKYVMFASVSATVLNIFLNYIFIRKYGYIAAGYTTITCYMMQAVLDYFAMRKVVKETVYDMKQILIMSFCVIVVALLSNLLYDITWIRYAIVFLTAFICLINKDRIVGYIRFKKS